MKQVLRRLHTPRGLKNVPIPHTVKKTAEIKEHVDYTGSKETTPAFKSAFVDSMLPDTVSVDALQPQAATGKVFYHVERSRAGNLPVYTDYNNAGGVWTEVRKVTGNVGALRNDLKNHLNLPKSDIWIKDASKVIVVKGNRSADIRSLLSQHF